MSGKSSAERLWTTATDTRDLMVHSGTSRWEIFAKASTVRETVVDRTAYARLVEVEETGVGVRSVRGDRTGFGAASGLGADAGRRAVDAAIDAELPSSLDPLPPARLLAAVEIASSAASVDRSWAEATAEQVARCLHEASDGRLELHRALVHEGSYCWLLTTADGFVASFASTATSLVAEVASGGESRGVRREWLHVARPESFDAQTVAHQLCDRSLLATSAAKVNSGSWDTILHSEVTAHLLAALAPFFLANAAETDPLTTVLDRNGLLTSQLLSIVDDRSDPEAPLSGPCDGEGLPAGRILLVDEGVPRHRSGCYRDALRCGEAARGGAVRLSYRDCPASGIANLKAQASETCTPAQLLQMAPRCLYLLRPLAAVRLDPQTDSYRLLASGVWIENGRVSGWQPVVELRGGIGQLLRRIEGVGTDARWYQTEAGFVSAPSILACRQTVVG